MSAAVPVGRLELRRERLLEAGERLFLMHGYAGASVNEIVRCAGGSLATLYGEFGSKQGLFIAIMCRRASALFDCEALRCSKDCNPRVALLSLGTRLLDRMLNEDSLAWYRMAISEGPRFPELREAILQVSLPAFLRSLGAALVAIGVANEKNQARLAEEFMSLVQGQCVFRAACGGATAVSARWRVRHVEGAIDAFLRLHAARER